MHSKHVFLTLAGISAIAKRNPISSPKGALRHLPAALLLLLAGALVAKVQDPGLPPINLGISNMLDGTPRSRGVSWLETNQLYQARGSRNRGLG